MDDLGVFKNHPYFWFNTHINIWVFPKIMVPQNGWFIREIPIKMDDLGGTPIFGSTPNIYIYMQQFKSHRVSNPVGP